VVAVVHVHGLTIWCLIVPCDGLKLGLGVYVVVQSGEVEQN